MSTEIIELLNNINNNLISLISRFPEKKEVEVKLRKTQATVVQREEIINRFYTEKIVIGEESILFSTDLNKSLRKFLLDNNYPIVKIKFVYKFLDKFHGNKNDKVFDPIRKQERKGWSGIRLTDDLLIL